MTSGAPAPAASAIEAQVRAYHATKKMFDAPPGSGTGRAAAKRVYQKELENLGRAAAY